MLHVARHKEGHLNAIAAFRPMLASRSLETQSLIVPGNKVGFMLPHDVYSFNLENYKADKMKLPQRSTTRTLESSGKTSITAMYDVKDDSVGVSTVTNAQIDTGFLSRYEKALEIVAESPQVRKDEYELRVLQFNAIGLEVLWVHNNNAEKDFYVPVISFYGITPFKVYKAKSFFELVDSAIGNIKPSIDSTMAP